MRTSLHLLVIVAAAACGGHTDDQPKAPPKPVASEGLEVFVGDKSVAKLTPAQLASWPRLDTLVPEDARRLGTWTKLELETGGAPSALERPSTNHPDKVPVVFPGANNRPAFGMFDPVELAKHGQPALRVDDLRAIRIAVSKSERGGDHQGGTGEGVDPTKLVVAIKAAAGERQLTGAEILKLPRESQPGNEDTKGWRLQQFLEAAGVKTYKSIVLIDAAGTALPLDPQDLDPQAAIPFIKLNKQGQLRFRLFKKQGTGWQPGADLRALTTIQIK
jgi:hypothetical protein